jgi:GTP-binding protein Era
VSNQKKDLEQIGLNAAKQPTHYDSNSSFRSGFVALTGRPNAGKSTLANAILGRKLLITSNVPQTTRHRFRAVIDGDGYQLILVDTPGIHKPHDLLGSELNATAKSAITDVDVIAWVMDSSAPFGRGDKWIGDIINDSGLPCILVQNKCEITDSKQQDEQEIAAFAYVKPIATVRLSALKQHNTEEFLRIAISLLPEGPLWFPVGSGTDQPLEVTIAEFIREKILLDTFDEVPHSVGVVVGELEYLPKRNLYRIFATIYVERESQKGIIVGKGGEKIRSIGSLARSDLEHFLGAKVFLDLRVKLKKGWRGEISSIHRFGYGEGIR